MLSKEKIKPGETRPIASARILIVPDKFKGTLPAPEVCAAIAKGWRSVRATDRLDLLPMSDGGDGFGEVMGRLLKARLRPVRTLDAAHQPIRTHWWWEPDRKLAIIESAQVVGMARLPAQQFHPFRLDTFGLGRVLNDAVRIGAEQCMIGVGGSATNDGGFGLGRALGWKFLNRMGRELHEWWQLSGLAHVRPPKNACQTGITVAVDVANPLLGPRGCSRVYGPQKGIRPEDLVLAEGCLRRLTLVLEQQLGIDRAAAPGAGAAGGLGFGLMAFAGAKAQSGFEVFAQAAGLEERVRRSDVVITGEGAVDRQTHMGKGVGQVMRLCRKLKIPCIVLAGVASAPMRIGGHALQIQALTDIGTLDQAKKQPAKHLEKLSGMVARMRIF
jgi:glycerate kinase